MSHRSRSKSRGRLNDNTAVPALESTPATPGAHGLTLDKLDQIFQMMQNLTMKVSQLSDTQNQLTHEMASVQENIRKQSITVKTEADLFKQAVTLNEIHRSLSSPGADTSSSEAEHKASNKAGENSAHSTANTGPTLVLDQSIGQLLDGAGCLNHIKSGAIVTQHGALIKDSAKIKPAPTDEKDLRVIAQRAGVKIISLTSSQDRAMAASVLSATRIAWPYGNTFDADTVKFPILTADCITSPTAFINWQRSIVDACKCASVHDILLVSLDVLANRIMQADFSVGDGPLDGDNKTALKAALIRACYDLSNQLYYVLKRAIMVNEPIVLESLQNSAKLHENSNPPLWLEGNVNYLWRCLDENYHRVTTSTIQQANRAFDHISYGNKGNQSTVTSASTTKLTLDIVKANRELSYVDKPRSDESLRSLLISCLPHSLWQFAIAVDVNIGDKKLSFSELGAKLIEHSRTIEERKGGNASSQQTNHFGVSGASTSAAKCVHCQSNNHTTAEHRKCKQCGGLHHPRKCPKHSLHPKDKSGKEGRVIKARVNAVETEVMRPVICHVVTSREGSEIVSVHYAAGSLEHRTYLQCVIDSGAAAHVSCSESHMFDVRELDHPVYVTLPDGGSIRVTKYGSMMLTKFLVLTQVLLVPKFRLNIVSVARLSDKGVSFHFGKENCTGKVHDKNENKWLTAFQAPRQENDVYILTLPKEPYEPIKTSKAKKLTGSQIAEKPKKAEYVDQKGDTTNRPTTISVKGPKVIPTKAADKAQTAQNTATTTGTNKTTGATTASTNAVTTCGGPDASKFNSTSDQE